MSMDIMVNPVITSNGHTYERSYIEEWFKAHTTDPLSNENITKKLVPNLSLKEAIEAFKKRNDVDTAPSVQYDEMYARFVQLELNLQSKAVRLDHIEDEITALKAGMAAIESRIVQSIPEDIVEQLTSLARSVNEADRAKVEELSQKKVIEESESALQYFVTMQVYINSTVTACAAIQSKMVANESKGILGDIASVINVFQSAVSSIPLASFGIQVMIGALNYVDKRQQVAKVKNVSELFRGDSSLTNLVAEAVALDMALRRKTWLESCTGGAKKGIRGRTGDAIRRAMNVSFNASSTDLAKTKATEDAAILLKAMMDNKIAFKSSITDSAEDKADKITYAALNYLIAKLDL